MSQPFYIKSGALTPAIPFAFTQGGIPINLTGSTVTFKMRLETGTALTVSAPATINSPNTLGTGYYAWQVGDTAVAGRYLVEWLITASGGIPEILPVRGYDHVVVVPALP